MRSSIVAIVIALMWESTLLAQTFSTNAQSSETKLKGCITTQNGKFALEDKQGKREVFLVGPKDLASHIGHAVTVQGNFSSAPKSSASKKNSLPEASRTFTVTKLAEMVSESCNTDTGKTEQAANAKPSPYHK